MNLNRRQIAVIGAGNMGEALIKGMLAARVASPAQLTASDPLQERRKVIGARYGVRTTADSSEAAASAQVVILAVKPQGISGVLQLLAPAMAPNRLLVTIAAGVTTHRIESELGNQPRVVRVMPNTPAQIGAGAAAIARGRYATDADLETAEAIMGAVGITVRTEERFLDAVTGLSGSGPAYVFMVAEAMIRSGIEVGLSPDLSRTLAIHTVLGAARLMVEGDEAPDALRRKVTSPGGTTEAALKVMAEGGLNEVFVEAIKAATQRSRELSNS